MSDIDHAHILRNHAWNVIALYDSERYDLVNAAEYIEQLEAEIERLEILVERAEQGGFS